MQQKQVSLLMKELICKLVLKELNVCTLTLILLVTQFADDFSAEELTSDDKFNNTYVSQWLNLHFSIP